MVFAVFETAEACVAAIAEQTSGFTCFLVVVYDNLYIYIGNADFLADGALPRFAW